MNKFEAMDKIEQEYGDCRITYKIAPFDTKTEKFLIKQNEENFEKVKEALDAVGIFLNIDKDRNTLSISVSPYQYGRVKNRYAGRKTKGAVKGKDENSLFVFYKYSDVVFMLQSMKDAEIAEILRMPIATYYRHKKKMKESNYYKSLDMNKVLDKEYLESIDGNFIF